ncbi:hypothetical protein D3C78_1885240 [compost metagenome]
MGQLYTKRRALCKSKNCLDHHYAVKQEICPFGQVKTMEGPTAGWCTNQRQAWFLAIVDECALLIVYNF